MNLDNTIAVKVSMLKQHGLLKPDSISSITMSFTFNDEPTAIMIESDTTNMRCRFIINFNGSICMLVYILEARPTNLGRGQQWVFKCPKTGATFRNLYFLTYTRPEDGDSYGGLLPRCMLYPIRYNSQLYSHWQRSTEWIRRSAHRKWGKPYYRGKLTPYGKRLQKYGE